MAEKRESADPDQDSKVYAIERGGETVKIQQAEGLFAVKKRARSATGELEAAAGHEEVFASLRFQPAESTHEIEVYRIDAGSRDEAMEVLRRERSDTEWCAHVYHAPGDPKGVMIPTDRIYIEAREGADPHQISQALLDHGLELVATDYAGAHAFGARLTSASTENPIKIAKALRDRPEIKLAEPDFAVRMKLHVYRPSDPLFPSQWHLENRGGVGLTAGADVKAPQAWDLTRGDPTIRICVMDDGIETGHPDFASPGKIVAPFDFGQSDLDPNPVSASDNHGTACAGVAVANENGRGGVGIAPGCSLMPYRTSGLISDASINALFDQATRDGADVISCSWGVNAAFFTLSTQMKSAIHRAATEGRGGRGIVIVFASGNENSPVNDPNNGKRSGFAIHPDVIAVNASNSLDQRSHYSNFGPETWICAPSSGAGGRRIVTTDRTGAAGYQAGDYTTVEGFGGTSSACPLVAGVCGLMLSVNPGLTALEVKEVLRETADKVDPASGGYDASGHSIFFGYGRVNAFRAVEEARRRLAPTAVRRVAYERTPGLAIPDFPSLGIVDAIEVDDAARVRAVQVEIDIEHSYRGDLVVELVGPRGATVRLHDRGGRFEDDLVATYTEAEAPALSSLTGGAARGVWALRVSDLARQDVGRLRRWAVILELEAGARTEWWAEPGLSIPDADPIGIASDIEVEQSGRLRSIELGVDIRHTYRGDLRVELEGPTGLRVPVHDGEGGGADDLIATYSEASHPALQAFVGAQIDIRGKWRLHVSDRVARDLGKLNAWRLKLLT